MPSENHLKIQYQEISARIGGIGRVNQNHQNNYTLALLTQDNAYDTHYTLKQQLIQFADQPPGEVYRGRQCGTAPWIIGRVRGRETGCLSVSHQTLLARGCWVTEESRYLKAPTVGVWLARNVPGQQQLHFRPGGSVGHPTPGSESRWAACPARP